MIYLDDNGVTVKAVSGAKGAKAGEVYELNGEKYYVAVDAYELRAIINKRSTSKGKDFPLNRIVTSKLTTMNSLFSYQKDFNEDISNWDTGRVKSMSEMFKCCEKFNQPIGHWDLSKVTATMEMFYGAKAFNQPIGDWNTAILDNFSNMFEGAESFNQPIENWNMSRCGNMLGMFKGASSFNQSLKNWKIGSGQPGNDWFYSPRMFSLFENAKAFNGDLSGWRLRGSLTGLFKGASSFNQPLDSWDVENVDSMKSLFEGAESFNQDISNWNTSNVTSFENTFYGASSFNQNIGKWNTSKATNFLNMFREASAFNQDISGWDVSNVKKVNGLFRGAKAFNQDISSWKLNESIKFSKTIFQDASSFDIENHSPFNEIKSTTKRVSVATQAASSLGIELTADDKKTISKIKKLLISRDLEQIDLGVELLLSLAKTEVYETLLFGCKIMDDGKLERPKMFTGSGPAQPFLDYALLNLIADAPKGAKVDESIDKENITSLDFDMFDFNSFEYSTKIQNSVSFSKFYNLKSLSIDFKKFNIKTACYDNRDSEKESGIDLSNVFSGNTITHLKVREVKGSLNWLENFTQLQKLDFRSARYYNLDDTDCFNNLKNLEELIFLAERYPDLDFLSECSKIKKLKLSCIKPGYGEDESGKLNNIDFLANLGELEDLRIDSIIPEMNVDGIHSCKNLKYLSIPIDGNTDLSGLKSCSSLETLILKSGGGWGHNFDISGRINDLQGLKDLKNLKNLKIEKFNFFGLENGNLMSDLKAKESQSNARVLGSDIRVIDSVIRYKAIPFTGTLFYNYRHPYNLRTLNRKSSADDNHIFSECEIVEGLKDGLYKEFYTTGKPKFEALYEKNKLIKITAFYDAKGENVLNNNGATLSYDLESAEVHRIGGDSGGFLKNSKPFNGFCYLEIDTQSSYLSKDIIYTESLFDILRNTIQQESFDHQNPELSKFGLLLHNRDAKISVVLKIKDGLISNDIFLAGSKEFSKITVEDDYDFERMNHEDKSAFEKIDDNKKHRLHIYFHKLSSLVFKAESLPETDDDDIAVLLTKGVKQGRFSNSTSQMHEIPMFYYLKSIINGEKMSKRQQNLNRPKLSTEDKKAFSEIKKQLTSRDYSKIDEAISKLNALNLDELFETLLEGCEIPEFNPNEIYPKIIRNKFFTGSKPAQPSLDYALFCIIANAPTDANIHDSLRSENITDLNVKTFGLAPIPPEIKDGFIPLDNLKHLNNLIIDLEIFQELNKGRDKWFINSNIKKLELTAKGSLKFFNNLKSLEYLDIEFGYYGDSIKDYEALESLENLKELKLTIGNYDKISLGFIKKNKKLKKLYIDLKNSWGDSHPVDDLNAIEHLNELEELHVKEISTTDLKALSKCKSLKKLTLEFYEYGREDFSFDYTLLNNCQSLESFSINGLNDYKMNARILDFNSLSGLKNLKNLLVDKVSIQSTKSIFLD